MFTYLLTFNRNHNLSATSIMESLSLKPNHTCSTALCLPPMHPKQPLHTFITSFSQQPNQNSSVFKYSLFLVYLIIIFHSELHTLNLLTVNVYYGICTQLQSFLSFTSQCLICQVIGGSGGKKRNLWCKPLPTTFTYYPTLWSVLAVCCNHSNKADMPSIFPLLKRKIQL